MIDVEEEDMYNEFCKTRKSPFVIAFLIKKKKIIITKILLPYGGKLTFHRFRNTPFYSMASAQPF